MSKEELVNTVKKLYDMTLDKFEDTDPYGDDINEEYYKKETTAINPYDNLVYDTNNIDIKSELKHLSSKKFYNSLTMKVDIKGKPGTKKRINKTRYTISSNGEEIGLYGFDNSIGMKLEDSELWLPYKHKRQVILYIIKNIPTIAIEGDKWEMWYCIYNGDKLDLGLYKGDDKSKRGWAYIKDYNGNKFKNSYYNKLIKEESKHYYKNGIRVTVNDINGEAATAFGGRFIEEAQDEIDYAFEVLSSYIAVPELKGNIVEQAEILCEKDL